MTSPQITHSLSVKGLIAVIFLWFCDLVCICNRDTKILAQFTKSNIKQNKSSDCFHSENLPDRNRSPLFDCSSPTARGSCSSPRKKPLWRFQNAPISQEPSQWGPRWDLSRTRPSISPPVRWVLSRSVRMHGTLTTLRLAPTSTSCQLHSAPNSSLLAKTQPAQIPNQNHPETCPHCKTKSFQTV